MQRVGGFEGIGFKGIRFQGIGLSLVHIWPVFCGLQRCKCVRRFILWDLTVVSGLGVFWELRRSKSVGGWVSGISLLYLF